ncbi:hypothetical protein [Tardiphaga alba]|uniref:hypothetical protein n=1 Tax=Tardiphaga alba TaxID=340268 RepID=UPI001BA79905|nr:hypothetical protein [Tardiphaga alba]
MTKPSQFALWLRYACAALLLVSADSVVVTSGHAQEVLRDAPAAAAPVAVNPPARVYIPTPRDPKNLDPTTNGLTLIHGNYCGVGQRPGGPIDALDVACMHHDACTPSGRLPTCDCNARLRDEAAAVARDPKQSVELQSMASVVATAATMMLCKPLTSTASAPPPAAPPPGSIPAGAPPAAPVSIVPEGAAQDGEEPAAAAPVPAESAPMSIAPRAQP